MASFQDTRSELLKKYGVTPSGGHTSQQIQAGGGQEKDSGKSNFEDVRERLFAKYSIENVASRVNSVDDWKKRYNELFTRVSGINRDNEFGQDYSSIGKEIESLLEGYSQIKDYAGNYGLPNAFRYASNLWGLQKEISERKQIMSQFEDEDDFLSYLKKQAYTQQLEESIPWKEQGDFLEEARDKKANGEYAALEEQIRKEQRDFYGTYSDRYVQEYLKNHTMDALPQAQEPEYDRYVDPDSPYYGAAKSFLDRQMGEYGQRPIEEPVKPGIANAEAEDETAYQGAIKNANAHIREKNRLDYVQKYTGKEYQDNFWGQFGGNYTIGRLSQDSSLAWNEYLDNPTEENRLYAQTIDQLVSEVQINNPDVFVDEGTLSIISKDLANYIPQLADQIKYEAGGAVAGAAAGFAVAGTTGYVPAIRKGIKAGVTAASGVYSYQTMRGAAFKSLLEAGADEQTARMAANNEAVISSAIEMGETALSMVLTGGGKAIDAVTGGSVAALKKQISDIAGKNVATKFMTIFFGYLANIGSESLEEATQESVSIANENDPNAGFLGLAKNAAGTFFDAVTNKDSENRDRVLEAGAGGARLAALMGGAETIGNAAITHTATSYNAKRLFGNDPQGLVQVALEVNPDSALANKLQTKLDGGKKITGTELAKLIGETETTTAEQMQSAVGSVVEQRLSEVGETGDTALISRAIVKKNMGEELNVRENRALNQSSIGDMVLRELKSGEIFDNVKSENSPGMAQEAAGQENGSVKGEQPIRNLEGKEIDAEVSEDGKTRIISTGQELNIKDIDSIKDGKITFKMEDDSLVDASDIQYASEDEAIIYDTVASMGVVPAQARVLVKGFVSGNVPANVYAKGMQDAYLYGKWGVTRSELGNGHFTSRLTQEQRESAYEVGRITADMQTKAEQAKKEAARGTNTEKQPGKVHYEGDRTKLTQAQQTNLKALDVVAETLGVQIHVFESQVGADGKRIGANGRYDTTTGEIYIDLYAGADGKGTMLFTAAHELTHFIRQESPAKFKALSDFLFEQYGKKGVSVQELVENQLEKARKANVEMSYDGAFEEVVADSMESMLTDGKVIQELKQQDKGLWNRVKKYVEDLCRKIREVYKKLKPDSFEGQTVAKMRDAAEEMRRLFTEGLQDAAENYQGAEKNTTREGDVKMQIRTANGNDIVWIEDNIMKENKGEPTHQFIANYIAEHIGEVYTIIESGQGVYIGKDLPGEYTQSKYTTNILKNNSRILKAKNRAAASLGEMIEIGTNRRWEKTKHPNSKDAKYGMYRYDTRFGFPVTNRNGEITHVNVYNAELLIRNASDGKKYLYDIVNIKKDTASSALMTDEVTRAEAHASAQKSDVSKNSIRNSGQDVKQKNSLRDSDGRQLSENQQKYFRNSVVRDENGSLLVMYHGTPNGGFTKFRSGSYFTQNPEYAAVYQKPGASMLSHKKTANNPQSYQVYLNMEKPFDTRNPKERDIFMKEYYRKYGTGAPLSESGLPDWTDGMDLQEFIEDNEYDYDGLILDEGAIGGYGEEVKSRGLSYVVFSSEQVKNVSNENPTSDPDIRYSLRDTDVQKVNAALEKQNEKLREDVTSLKELLKLQKSVTGGKLYKDSSLTTAAKYLMENTGAKGDVKEFKGLLRGVYDYIAGGEEISWDGIMEKAEDSALWLEDHMEKKTKRDPYADDVLREIKGGSFYLDEQQKQEAAYQYGSVNDFRKGLFGRLNVSDNASMSLDSWWSEQSALHPDIFDPNISSSDMPGALMDALDSLKGMTVSDQMYDQAGLHQDLLQKIYDGYWRLSTLYTVADVKQKQINELKGKHKARMEKVNEDHKKVIAKLKAEHKADVKNLREDLNKKADDRVNAVRKQYQQSRAKSVDGRRRTEMRHKIQRVVKDLNDLLLNGTKDRHVPIELQKAVAEALDAVNMDTVGAEQRIAKLQAEMEKAKDPKKVQEIARKIANVQGMGDSMRERLQGLKAGYEAIINSEDPLIADAYSPEIAGQLMTLATVAGDTPLRDMNRQQLEAVYNAYTMVKTVVSNANKSFKNAKGATVQELSEKVMAEVQRAGWNRQYSIPVLEALEKFGFNNLKPVYVFELMGSDTFKEIFRNVRKGEDTWIVDVNEARDFRLEQMEKYGYNQWDMSKRQEFTSATGEKFKLNLPQMMSLYAYSRRKQAADHIRKGGIVFDENTEISKKTKLGVTMKFNPADATAYNISNETMAEIVGKLSKEQKAYVEAMQEYLSKVMGEKGNEVSLQMCGIKLFGEEFYFPLRSADQYMERAREQKQGDKKIKNAGFSKQTVENASSPVVLSGFDDLWADHVNEMSVYHAFVLPMEDFYRVWNYKTENVDNKQTRSVNAVVQNAFGKAATDYIDQLLKDLNGGARMDPTTGLISKGMNLFKKGAVFASASVVIQQPSAIGRALAMIDSKYFAGPRITKEKHKVLWEQLKKYAPVAAIKEMGYFDVNMGKSTTDYILGQEHEGFGEKAKAFFKDSGYRDEALSRGAALADEITWCNIWEAVKRETRAKHPGMDVRSDAFLKLAGERFTDVIVKTQVYDSVLSRSGNMRSTDTGMKMVTAFMAEPTTSMNMIVSGLVEGKRGGVEGRRYCRRMIGAVAAAQLINSILVSFVYAARDDDEDETYLEKYLEAFTGAFLDSLNPATYIPILKDIVSIFQGYDVERSDMSVVSDLWKSYKRLSSKNLSPWRKVEDFAGSWAQIFGVPLKNIMRDARALYQMVDTIVGPEKNTLAGAGYAIKEGASGKKSSSFEQMFRAYMRGDQAHLDRVADRFMRNSDAPNERRMDMELESGFQSYLKNQFLDEKVTEQEVRDVLTGYLDVDSEKVEAELTKWKGELETGKTESDMVDDYLRKTISGEAYMQYLQTYGGKSREQAESAELKLRCERDEGIAYSEIKGEYLGKDLSGDRAAKLLSTYGDDVSMADAKSKVLEWDFEAAYGIAYSDRKRAFLDGEISKNDLLTGLQKYGGYDREEAEEAVDKLVFEDKHGFAYSEKKSAYLGGEVSRSTLKNILIKEMEYEEEKAELTMKAYDWQKSHPESKHDTTTIMSYLKPLEGLGMSANDCGISVDTFAKEKKYIASIKSDKDENGKGIPYSRINKAFPYIASLPLSSEQKTAFAVACGWELKTVNKKKLW